MISAQEKKTACVAIPVYTTDLAPSELVSLNRCVEILGHHPMILIKPVSLDVQSLLDRYPNLLAESFSDGYFANVQNYNRMMLSDEFYARFDDDYQYMLLHQLDAYVFSDQLLYWCKKGYDYIGAPWIPHNRIPTSFKLVRASVKRKYFRLVNQQLKNHAGDDYRQQHYATGNGGFSLRRISALRKVLSVLRQRAEPYRSAKRPTWAEDIFFSIEANRYRTRLKTPRFTEASNFAWEMFPEVAAFFCENHLPFGFHAWNKLSADQWRLILAACRT